MQAATGPTPLHSPPPTHPSSASPQRPEAGSTPRVAPSPLGRPSLPGSRLPAGTQRLRSPLTPEARTWALVARPRHRTAAGRARRDSMAAAVTPTTSTAPRMRRPATDLARSGLAWIPPAPPSFSPAALPKESREICRAVSLYSNKAVCAGRACVAIATRAKRSGPGARHGGGTALRAHRALQHPQPASPLLQAVRAPLPQPAGWAHGAQRGGWQEQGCFPQEWGLWVWVEGLLTGHPAMRPCCWGISTSLFHGAVLLVALSSFTQSRKQQRVAFIATARSNKLSACGNSGLNCISLSVNCSRDGLPLPRGGSADRQPLDVSKHLCPSRCQHPQMAPCVAMCLGWHSGSWGAEWRSPQFPLQPPQVCEHGSTVAVGIPWCYTCSDSHQCWGFVISIWKV